MKAMKANYNRCKAMLSTELIKLHTLHSAVQPVDDGWLGTVKFTRVTRCWLVLFFVQMLMVSDGRPGTLKFSSWRHPVNSAYHKFDVTVQVSYAKILHSNGLRFGRQLLGAHPDECLNQLTVVNAFALRHV